MKQHSNLLKFTNDVLTGSDKRGAYNITTGERDPDTGFFVSLLEEPQVGVDEEIIRAFWGKHADLLAMEKLWLGIWHDGNDWIYSVGELIDDRQEAYMKAIGRGTGGVWDNEAGDFIECPDPQLCGTETQKRDYARREAVKMVG